MRLADFIRSNEEAIIAGWQEFAQTYLPSAEHMDRTALRDHIIGLLRFVADDLETPETEKERSDKAKGQGPIGGKQHDGAAETHADLRFTAGFDTIEMISEFRALRASVIKLWRAEWAKVDDVLPDLLRFNEAIDQIMTESLALFSEKITNSGNDIIETLVNDVRDPLLAMHQIAEHLLESGRLSAEDVRNVVQMSNISSKVNGSVSDVIEAVGIPLGKGGSDAIAPIGVNQKGKPQIRPANPKLGT